MLIDAKHKPWAIAVALLTAAGAAVYVPYHLLSLNGPSGGSWVGLSFGIAAFALMAFAGLLGARRKFPALRLGRPEMWMRAHLWLGLLLVPLVFFHAGFRFGGTMTVVLLVLLILVTLSGVLGLVLQQILPRIMTLRVPMETIYGQIDHVLEQLLTSAEIQVTALVGALGYAPPGQPLTEGSAPLKKFYLEQIRPFLEEGRHASPLASAAQSTMAFTTVRALLPPALHPPLKDLELKCEERRQLAAQVRLHHWLHGWLLVHVPLSYALLLLSAVHAVQSLRY